MTLTQAELETLGEITHHYERVMGFVRHIVVATAPRGVRRRYRFIVLEGNELDARVASLLGRVERTPGRPVEAQVEIVVAVAFWGRLLSNLLTKRSRRRLSAPQINTRESLEERFRQALELAWRRNEAEVREAIATRRKREAEWMLDRMPGRSAGDDVVHRANVADHAS